MLNLTGLNLMGKQQAKDEKERGEIIAELEAISEMIKKNEMLFNLADDDKIIEALIYEQKSLQAKYVFLLQTAREKGIKIEYTDRL